MKKKAQPKNLRSKADREMAREARDFHWSFMERLDRQGTVHVCPWNKYRHEERPDELRLSLIDGEELIAWLRAHPEWFQIGPQNTERWTNPISLTEAGRQALKDRDKYDMEPVFGGLVEPGWQAIPSPKVAT